MKGMVIRFTFGNRMKLCERLPLNFFKEWKRRYCVKTKVVNPGGYRKKGYQKQSEEDETGYLILIFPFTTFLLGVWQVKRQFWKTDLKNFLTKRYEEEPIPLPESLDTIDNHELEYRRIKVRGEFQYDKEFYLGPTTGPVPTGPGALLEHKAPGFYLITPFKLEGRNYSIMVNRGFLPESILLKEEMRLQSRVYGTQELVGILRKDQDTRYAKYIVAGDVRQLQFRGALPFFSVRHLETLAKYCGSAPVYLECLPKDFGQFSPTITAKAKPELRDDHTTYAIIWFTLTIITTMMWYSTYRQGHKTLHIYKTMEQQKNFQRNPRVK